MLIFLFAFIHVVTAQHSAQFEESFDAVSLLQLNAHPKRGAAPEGGSILEEGGLSAMISAIVQAALDAAQAALDKGAEFAKVKTAAVTAAKEIVMQELQALASDAADAAGEAAAQGVGAAAKATGKGGFETTVAKATAKAVVESKVHGAASKATSKVDEKLGATTNSLLDLQDRLQHLDVSFPFDKPEPKSIVQEEGINAMITAVVLAAIDASQKIIDQGGTPQEIREAALRAAQQIVEQEIKALAGKAADAAGEAAAKGVGVAAEATGKGGLETTVAKAAAKHVVESKVKATANKHLS